MRFGTSLAGEPTEEELRELLEYHELTCGSRFAFERSCTRRTRLKRGPLDCGHVIDGSEPYRYQVWKVPGTRGVEQRLDCEFCARDDEGRSR